MNNTKRGFTLIELLVVIAIIAILAAILFPVFTKVREKARQTSCLSNEKQLGLAFAQYQNDNNETWPTGVSYSPPSATIPLEGFGWAAIVNTYVAENGAFKCADDITLPSPQAGYTDNPVSYAFNDNLAGIADASLTAPPSTVVLFEIENASANIQATLANNPNGDGASLSFVNPSLLNASYADDGTYESGITYPQTNGVNGPIYVSGDLGGITGVLGGAGAPTQNEGTFINGNALHTGGSNFLLADGHAKWLRGSAVSPGLDAQAPGQAESAAIAPPHNNACATDNTTFTATFSLL